MSDVTIEERTAALEPAPRPAGLDRLLGRLMIVDWELVAYVVILLLAILSRFWDLGTRVMSHDESLHTRYSWRLYRGEGFSHTPLMHGPLLFHAVAFSYLLFGDNDFTSRIYVALIGVAVVMLPMLMRRWLGRVGAVAASVFFLISPMILYYSRYIRHDLPAILAALVIALATWRYIETRKFGNLVWLGIAQAVLFASKEVSFIYVAIFGSFLLLFFLWRLLDAPWTVERWRRVFLIALAMAVLTLAAMAAVVVLTPEAEPALPPAEGETAAPADPEAAPDNIINPMANASPLMFSFAGLLGAAVLAGTVSVLIGQRGNLRSFPELDVAVAMGTLILPSLTPFLIHFAGFNPMDTSAAGVTRSLLFTVPVFAFSVVVGMLHFTRPPQPRRVEVRRELTDAELAEAGERYDPDSRTVLLEPDTVDRLEAFLTSRWWAIGGPYWLIFVFFFTTMFTNGQGIGTGVVGSLGYWLEQQEVKRGSQPWYYYMLILTPLYEFLPLILSAVAGSIGLGRWLRPRRRPDAASDGKGSPAEGQRISLHAPVQFPVLLFIGYWAVLNYVAYSVAGEKMPWLTTHLTTPMILLAGWVTGRLIERIRWRELRRSGAWVLLLLIPVLVAALMRGLGPACGLWEANPLCNTVIPESYQQGVMAGRTVEALAATGAWLAAAVVAVGVLLAVYTQVQKIGGGQFARLLGLFGIGWLSLLTARAAWQAAYVNYDYPTEFLVYAHASDSVKRVTEQIEELSLRTTDGYALRVAYDDTVRWPVTWYMRNFPNSVDYGDQPSRGLIGDAPVIIAGPNHWARVESMLGDRFYQFEYIRMWWPMQEYFGYEEPAELSTMLGDVARDPALQRGLWEIFTRRSYDAYADAVAAYRDGNRPVFTLERWPVADRMRVYIRKDLVAQVWEYGVAASEIAEATDPYAENSLTLAPQAVFGGGALTLPHGLAVHENGTIYVADSNNHRIVVFAPDGTLLRTFGMYGPAPAEGVLNEPWDVAVGPSGNVYVADTWNHRIAVFDAQGTWLRTWGVEGIAAEGSGEYGLWGPRGVAVDAEERVYVADTGNKRVLVYTAEGEFVRQIGGPGVLQGELDEPVGLAIGPDGTLAVADTWNRRVQLFTQDGTFVREWLVEAWFAQSNQRPYITFDAAGNVLISDPDASRLIAFDASGTFLYSFGDLSTLGLSGGLATGPDGQLYVTDTQNGNVQVFTLPDPPPAAEEPAE